MHVALKAGVSVPTVYAYFDTRESLTEAVLKTVDARITKLFGTPPLKMGWRLIKY